MRTHFSHSQNKSSWVKLGHQQSVCVRYFLKYILIRVAKYQPKRWMKLEKRYHLQRCKFFETKTITTVAILFDGVSIDRVIPIEIPCMPPHCRRLNHLVSFAPRSVYGTLNPSCWFRLYKFVNIYTHREIKHTAGPRKLNRRQRGITGARKRGFTVVCCLWYVV